MHADHAGQRHRKSKAGVKAQTVEIRCKARLGASHPEIAHHGQSQTAADGRALHRADHRFGGGEQPHGFAVNGVDCTRTAVRIAAGCIVALGKIGSRTKRGALSTQHDGAALRIGFEGFERIGDAREHHLIKEIVRRLLHLDDANVAIQGHGNRGIAGNVDHESSPLKCLSVRAGQNASERARIAARPSRPAHQASAPNSSRQVHSRRVAKCSMCS